MPFENSKAVKARIILCVLCCALFDAAHAQFENAQKGDIIDIDGVKAIVFATDGEGHGSAMSITVLRGKKDVWCSDKKAAKQVATYSETDGKANTRAVYDYVQANDMSLSEFPAFEWCHSLGEGWYIPAVKQLESFVNFILGNDQEFDWDDEDEFELNTEEMTTKSINERMLEAGGIPFLSSSSAAGQIITMAVYTSTKADNDKVYLYEMDQKKNVWRFRKAAPSSIGKYTVGRAFYDF